MRSRGFLCLVLAATGLLLPGLALAAGAERAVLVLDQSSAGLPFNTAVAGAIRSTINADSKSPVSFYSEHLDANRFFGPDYDNELVQFLTAKYRDRHIDVVTVFGVLALDFVIRHHAQLWPTAPVVFAAIDEATIARKKLPDYVTGATMQLALLDMVKVARIAVPDLRKIALVGDPLERQTFYRHFLDEIPAVSAQLEIINLTDLPLGELAQRLATLPDHTAVIYTGIYYTSEGVSYVPAELTSQITAWANRPVVINVSSYLNKGAVGGYIVQATPIGQQVGRMALRLLAGEAVSDIPMVKVPSQLIFEWPALQRWKISEKILPPQSRIYFRDPSVWEQYRAQVIAVCALVLIQGAMISGLLYERRRRHLAEVQLRQRMAELAHINRYAMAGELTASIAHEINQPLGSILTNAETAQLMLKMPAPDLNELGEILGDIQRDDQRASDVIVRLRSLLKKTPFELSDFDLNGLVGETIELLSGLGAAREVRLDSFMTALPLPVKADRVQLQQVIVNLVINAMDAMSAIPLQDRNVNVSTAREGTFAELSIKDSGPGIPQDSLKQIFEPFFTTKPEGMGMGLSIARTIVEAHGGQLSVENRAGGGAVFRVRLKLEHPAE